MIDQFQHTKAFDYGCHLLQKICSEHQDFCIRAKTLDCPKITNSFLVVFGGRHDLKYVKRGPRHIVAKHLKIYKLQQRRSFQVCLMMSPVLPPLVLFGKRTHVRPSDFGSTFSKTVLYVICLSALVISQTSDEVI